ncbi:Holliday junction ATP-dependent DNA helicase RuvB [Rickettsiales bacterium Ac37b]|nr:Holliday junction ATP-dependent DNA helicase RuvB [Rickettsiales bacterium Ac37b]
MNTLPDSSNLVNYNASEEEKQQEKKLRPLNLSDFIGQQGTKENLQIFITAAKARKSALDHVLLHGPPGLGKTTMAQIIAREMGSNFKATAGPLLTKAGDLAALLTNLEQGDILFIDEIHRLPTQVEEVLYSAMEDFTLDLIIGEGPGARSVRIDIPPFTLVGATTRLGLLTNPLRDRFGIQLRMNFYSFIELEQVIERGANILGLNTTIDGHHEIAKRSRGTPRIALRLLRRVRDIVEVYENGIINAKSAELALQRLEVDNLGLDVNDKRYLNFIAEHYGMNPVGLETIAAALFEQKDTICETIEPYLIQQGLIQRTPRGRILTIQAFSHLGLVVPEVDK